MSTVCECNKFEMVDTKDVFYMLREGSTPIIFDPVPTEGSMNLLTSGTIYNALENIDSGVTSVNGQTGDVVLDAGNIGYDGETTYPDATVGKELGTINSALTSLQSVTEIIDTASGAIASFPDGAGLPMRSLVAEIVPQQDLHGYESPWAAGGGKNKCSLDSFSLEKPQERAKRIAIDTIPAGTYTISWVSNTTATTTMQIQDANNTSMVGNITITTSGSVTKTFTSDATQIYAFISTSAEDGSTATISNLQIELGSAATPFAPYSNECPITGWTGLSGKRCGVNQWDEDWEVGAISTPTGQNTSSTTRIRSKNYIPVDPEKTFLFVGTGYNAEVLFYDKYKNFISKRSPDVPTAGGLLNQPSNCYFVRFTMYSGYGTTYKNDISINCPSTDTEYHAYTSLPITVSWQTEAGTVYDGYIDVVSGELVAEVATKTFDGSSDEVISQTPLQGYSRFAIVIPDDSITWTDQAAVTEKLWSNEFKESTNIATGNGTIGIHYRANGSHQIVVGMGTLLPDDLTQFRTWLSNNPLQVVYTLAEPVVYQLTPQQIETLIGNNTVFVDTVSVSVTYQASIKGYIDKVLGA